ncbi:MAG: hypothetical protein ACRBFS_01015 [Aureispira sp.]
MFKFRRSFSETSSVLNLRDMMIRQERIALDRRELAHYLSTYNAERQYSVEELDFYQQVKEEQTKVEAIFEELTFSIEAAQKPLVEQFPSLQQLDLDLDIDMLGMLPFKLHGDVLKLTVENHALAIYETPIANLVLFDPEPNRLMVIEEQETALVVIPEQETALAIIEKQETALVKLEESIESSSSSNKLSLLEKIKIVRKVSKTIQGIIKDDSAIVLGELKKLKNLPKVKKHFEAIEKQGKIFEESYGKYKNASSKEEKIEALEEMINAGFKLTNALFALIGLIMLLRKIYQSHQEINAAIASKNQETQETLETELAALDSFQDLQEEAKALQEAIEEQIENSSGFWNFIQTIGESLGVIEQTDLTALRGQLTEQQANLEILLKSINSLKTKISALEEQDDVTIEDALTINAQGFYEDLIDQIEATIASIQAVPEDITKLEEVYTNLKKLKKVPIISSDRAL